jgi:hypothetical protein
MASELILHFLKEFPDILTKGFLIPEVSGFLVHGKICDFLKVILTS